MRKKGRLAMKNSDITQGQVIQIDKLVKIATDQAVREYLNKGTAQRLIEDGNSLQSQIRKLIKKVGNQSTGVQQKHVHYKSVEDQLKILHKIFPKIVTAKLEIAQQPLPKGARGWFVVPQLKMFDKNLDYQTAVEKICNEALDKKYGRAFDNWFGSNSDYYIDHCERTEKMFDLLTNSQKEFDCIVFPGQIGFRHFDLSADQYEKRYYKNEFGLGSYEIGCLFLTHGSSLFRRGKPGIICPGDDYKRYVEMVLYFDRGFRPGEELHLDEIHVDEAFEYGSSTGFLPNEVNPT